MGTSGYWPDFSATFYRMLLPSINEVDPLFQRCVFFKENAMSIDEPITVLRE